MLIEIPDYPPAPQPSAWRRAWDLGYLRAALFLAVGVGLALLSSMFSPLPAYGLILAGCVCIGRALGGIVPSTPGLKDHRQ